MKRSSMPVDDIEKGLGWRHPNIIIGGIVIGANAADAKIHARSIDQAISLRQDQLPGWWNYWHDQMVR
ncbi:hypothetical protein D3C86_2208650 [compost metagenome]